MSKENTRLEKPIITRQKEGKKYIAIDSKNGFMLSPSESVQLMDLFQRIQRIPLKYPVSTGIIVAYDDGQICMSIQMSKIDDDNYVLVISSMHKSFDYPTLEVWGLKTDDLEKYINVLQS